MCNLVRKNSKVNNTAWALAGVSSRRLKIRIETAFSSTFSSSTSPAKRLRRRLRQKRGHERGDRATMGETLREQFYALWYYTSSFTEAPYIGISGMSQIKKEDAWKKRA